MVERVPFGVGDVLWVESAQYPPSVGSLPGYELWLTGAPVPVRAPSSGLWLVSGWELAAGTQELVRLRTVCVPAATPRARWMVRPPAPYRDAAAGWAQPTQVLPVITRGERMRRGASSGGACRPLMTPLAAQRAASVCGQAVGAQAARGVDDETRDGGGPFMDEAEVIGLYPVDVAAVAGRTSLTDLGSGQWRTDD